MEELSVESAGIEEIRIENRVQLTKVYLGGGDEYITVSGNDLSIFDRFMDAREKLEEIAKEAEENEDSAGNDIKKEIEERAAFSKSAADIMDGVLGEGATRKFFADVYAELPDFMPDVECFLDFWDALIPVIERLSEHKIKLEKLASRKRMEKYKPQDFKRKPK